MILYIMEFTAFLNLCPYSRLVRRAIGTYGIAPGQFNMPMGLTTNSRDEIFVADRQNHRVQKLSPDGKFVQGYGGYGNRAGSLSHPEAVAVSGDRLFVVDTGNHRVQVRGQILACYVSRNRAVRETCTCTCSTCGFYIISLKVILVSR